MKIAIVLGTRPEIIRLSPIIRYLENTNQKYFIIHTGQHYDYNMDAIFFDDLNLPQPSYNLKIGSGTHAEEISRMLPQIEKILEQEMPDIVFVYGDTNSALSGALVASRLKITLAHIEAGCRSFDKSMPEEINRILIDHISDLLFPPDQDAYNNLIKEGLTKSKIFLYGNLHLESIGENYKISQKKSKILNKLNLKKDYAVLTIHRPENSDKKEKLKKILETLSKIDIPIVFPVHPRTKKMIGKFKLEGLLNNFINIPPLGYIDFLKLIEGSKVVFTDSGGIQIEANIIDKPCIVLRDTTEWIYEVNHGTSFLVGFDERKILNAYENIENKTRKIDYSKYDNVHIKILKKCKELIQNDSKR